MSKGSGKVAESHYKSEKAYLAKLFTILFIIFAITCFSLYSFTDNVNSKLTEKAAINSAEIYIKALEEFRTVYTSEVVNTAKLQGLEITHDYHNKSNAIPLPATLSMLLGERMGDGVNGTQTRLYSPFPFPWREAEGGLQDAFSHEAWDFLKNSPQQSYAKFEENEQGQFLRFAKADLMRESCVNCHNSHEFTPKDDWKVGDVRGILEVTLPLNRSTAYSNESLLNLFWLLVGISSIGIATISFFSIRVRRATQRLAENSLTKERQNSLNNLFTGDQTLDGLANKILSFLAPVIRANQAALFLSDTKKEYHLIGSYAVEVNKLKQTSFKLGQGLVGQCAQEEVALIIDAIPNDYMKVSSGLGEALPKVIGLIPIKYKSNVIAVLEFSSLAPFEDEAHEILAPLLDIIATALQTSQSRNSIDNLLRVNQEQVSELKTQQEELTSSNQILEEQTLQLRQSENELKASEEELKLQSDQLRASNEELEEKQESLQRQTTQLIESKKELEKSAENLTQASKYKSEFLANMSHELRTPLNSILILSKILTENKEENLTLKQVEEVDIIHQGGQSLLTLINDIMDLSKVEAGMLDINIDAVSLNNISHHLTNLFNPVATDKGIDFTITIDEKLPEFIQTDHQRLEQILKNFLSNAFKFTKEGEVTLSVEQFSIGTKGLSSILDGCSVIAFSVSDTGIGIPLDKQNAIFETFQQADGATNREYGGTGLGLSISRELTRLLGGEIKLTSQLGKGSCFTLYLPQSMSINQPVLESSFPIVTPVKEITNNEIEEGGPIKGVPLWLSDDRHIFSLADRTLLIIEDDKVFAKILIELVRSMGFKAIATNMGREGIFLAKDFCPSGILLDLGLPDIDGLQVLEQLKNNLKTRHIPVHVLSAKDKKVESLNLGAFNYLDKPTEAATITSVLEDSFGKLTKDVKKILLVEDDNNAQIAVKHLLETPDINVTFADTATEACQLLSHQQYDCIILDLGLPDISGTELVQTIRSQENSINTPIIIYTGQEITKEQQQVLEKFSLSIVIKGAESPERLLDDVAMFLHQVEHGLSTEQQETLKMLHDENEMLKDRRVLVVDDDLRNVFAITRVLESTGLKITQAENGQAALDAIGRAKQPFELILMDMMMPIMDGIEATQKIREIEIYQSTPIIALTAKAMPSDRHKCIEAGASEYLTKPLDMDKLLSILRVWLYQRKY